MLPCAGGVDLSSSVRTRNRYRMRTHHSARATFLLINALVTSCYRDFGSGASEPHLFHGCHGRGLSNSPTVPPSSIHKTILNRIDEAQARAHGTEPIKSIVWLAPPLRDTAQAGGSYEGAMSNDGPSRLTDSCVASFDQAENETISEPPLVQLPPMNHANWLGYVGRCAFCSDQVKLEPICTPSLTLLVQLPPLNKATRSLRVVLYDDYLDLSSRKVIHTLRQAVLSSNSGRDDHQMSNEHTPACRCADSYQPLASEDLSQLSSNISHCTDHGDGNKRSFGPLRCSSSGTICCINLDHSRNRIGPPKPWLALRAPMLNRDDHESCSKTNCDNPPEEYYLHLSNERTLTFNVKHWELDKENDTANGLATVIPTGMIQCSIVYSLNQREVLMKDDTNETQSVDELSVWLCLVVELSRSQCPVGCNNGKQLRSKLSDKKERGAKERLSTTLATMAARWRSILRTRQIDAAAEGAAIALSIGNSQHCHRWPS